MLVEKNAKHRKGFRLQELQNSDITYGLIGEALELREAKTKEEILEESADTMACLLHMMIRNEISCTDLAREVDRKLKLRFTT